MVKRTGILCLLFVLLAGMLVESAAAGKRRPRKVTRDAEATYALPWLGTPSTAGGCVNLGVANNDCPKFTISTTERWVRMEVADETGTPTAFRITQRRDPNSLDPETHAGPFCGSSGEEPVELVPGVDVIVHVYALGDIVCPGSFGTSGTVTAVFSNVP